MIVDPTNYLRIQKFERCRQIGKDKPFSSESEDENGNRRKLDYDADLVRVHLHQPPNINSRIDGNLRRTSDPPISKNLVLRSNHRGVSTPFERFFVTGRIRERCQLNHGGLLAQKSALKPACKAARSVLSSFVICPLESEGQSLQRSLPPPCRNLCSKEKEEEPGILAQNSPGSDV